MAKREVNETKSAGRVSLLLVLGMVVWFTGLWTVQSLAAESKRIVLAVGAHAGDMEITAGAVLAKHSRLGDKVTLLHLTLGEEGNPRLSSEDYGKQKRQEALAAAAALGADVFFGPYFDGQLPDTETSRLFVAEIIRQVKPTHLITHWKNSFHKDHSITHAVVMDAVLMAALPGVKTESPNHRGIRGIYFAENWEDEEGFEPYLLVDVSEDLATWEKAVQEYEFIRGGISSFAYLEYYKALARVRGLRHGFSAAVAFDLQAHSKKRTLSNLP